MPELLKVYNLENQYLGLQPRIDYYREITDEFFTNGSITRKIHSVRVFVMNSKGRIYVQKRSSTKLDNPGLYDKTIGGHIIENELPTLTVVRECVEELGFPAVVVEDTEFSKSTTTIDLTIIGILRHIKHEDNYISIRTTQRGILHQPFITDFYIGYYDGPMKFLDGESTGIETFSIKELYDELEKYPERFTNDLQYMISEFSSLLKPLSSDVE